MNPRLRLSRLRVLSAVCVLPLAILFAIQGLPVTASGASAPVKPNPVNGLDCNGHSLHYRAIRLAQRALCAEPVAREASGDRYRFYDNGHYVGHDEPAVRFISNAPGSGNHFTFLMQLAKDPAARATPSGSVTDYAELGVAPWFSEEVCDPNSYPQNPCTPHSDRNTSSGAPTDAGSAFLELQFYPPGYPPFLDSTSCDATRYCAALNIDSAECTYNYAYCNPDCGEPVNFAFLQTDGVPPGPPSPQLSDDSTYTPNGKTLMMGQGDTLRVTVQDTPHGFETRIDDLTTGQSGYMVASAANGFMTTNLYTCDGTPFDFHFEFDTASVQNQLPWGSPGAGLLMENEIGHGESCSGLANQTPLDDGAGFKDPRVYDTCMGGIEPGGAGEGPCNSDFSSCANARTQGGGPCSTSDPTTAALCEFSDGFCQPAGPRPVTINGVATTISWPVALCDQNAAENGDLDFDGNSYIPDWPDGSPNHPVPFFYRGPFDQRGASYPQLQFETNVGFSENNCDFETAKGCTVPPQGSRFYPFWTLNKHLIPDDTYGPGRGCAWAFGNTIAHATTDSFGGDTEYGTPLDSAPGLIISAVQPNPSTNGGCRR